MNSAAQPRKAWIYNPGQRRVRAIWHTQSGAAHLRIGLSDHARAGRRSGRAKSMAATLCQRRVERTRKGRPRRSPAFYGLFRRTGFTGRAKGNFGGLGRSLSQVFSNFVAFGATQRFFERYALGVRADVTAPKGYSLILLHLPSRSSTAVSPMKQKRHSRKRGHCAVCSPPLPSNRLRTPSTRHCHR